ncbi:hypothetical protein O6H91_Y405800 [Diphasiastrum complanatum]|nr:hypothetical protein O6H91_Y405800 [Diphasiastrum complanatum]
MEASALSLSSSLQSRSVSFASNSSLSSARPAPSAALALSSAPIPGLSVFCSDWHVTARAACFSSRKTSCWEWSGARSVAMQATVGTGDVDSAVTLATNPGGNAAAAAATQNADSSVDVRVDAAAASNSNAVGSGKKSKGDLSPGKMARSCRLEKGREMQRRWRSCFGSSGGLHQEWPGSAFLLITGIYALLSDECGER